MTTAAGTETGPRRRMTATTATSPAAVAVATAAAAGSATRLWVLVTVTVSTAGRVVTVAAARRRGGGRIGQATAVPPTCVTPATPPAAASRLAVAVGPTCGRLASRRPRTGAL